MRRPSSRLLVFIAFDFAKPALALKVFLHYQPVMPSKLPSRSLNIEQILLRY